MKRGVRDMLRLSSMSGTSYGACILHAAPESYGRTAGVREDGRRSRSTMPARSILNISDEELAARRAIRSCRRL